MKNPPPVSEGFLVLVQLAPIDGHAGNIDKEIVVFTTVHQAAQLLPTSSAESAPSSRFFRPQIGFTAPTMPMNLNPRAAADQKLFHVHVSLQKWLLG